MAPPLPQTDRLDLNTTPLPPQLQPTFPAIRGYELLKVVGCGGMGIVYEARHKELGRRVAIKTLRGEALADPEFRLRFRTEAESIARLQHPNIIQVFEVGSIEPAVHERYPTPFIALEFVDGGSLAQRVDAPLDARQSATLVQSLARAAHAAHKLGVIHRDLKPANVLLTRDGVPKIADFGIAKQIDAECATAAQLLTRDGTVMGTPEYMAPEHLQGAVSAPGIDIYALGVILYELLTGRVPFQGGTFADTMLLVMNQDPVPPRRLQPGVPRDLETVCLKCLEKNPDKRYRSAEALADDLAAFLEGRTISARPVGNVERTVRWARRNPAVAFLSVAVCLVGITGLSGIVWKWDEARSSAAAARQNAARASASALRAENALAAANEAAENERFERYRISVFAASSALRLHDTNAARRSLEDAPVQYRDWVWKLLAAQLDGSQHVFNSGSIGTPVTDFTPDGRWAWGVHPDGGVRVYDPVERTEQVVVPGAAKARNPVVSNDGRRLAYLNRDSRVTVCEVPSGRVLVTCPIKLESSHAFEFSPDGTRLFLEYYETDRAVRHKIVWDIRTGDRVLSFGRPRAVSLLITPNGRTVAVRAPGDAMSLWDMASGREIAKLDQAGETLLSMRFSPTGDRFVTVSPYPWNTVRIWDTASGRLIATCRGHENQMNHLVFSPDHRRIATSSMDRSVCVWDATDAGVPEVRRPAVVLEGHSGWVHHAAFSPDGSKIVSASHDRTLRCWDARTGKLLGVLHGHTQEVTRVAYQSDGSTVCSSGPDGTVRLWDARLLERGPAIRGHEKFVYSVAFHPDGTRVASGAWDGTARIWDATSGSQLQTLTHPGTKIVASVAFHPNGELMATLSRDNHVRLWNPDTGQEVHKWRMPNDVWPDGRLGFSPRGDLLAAGSAFGKVHIWDVRTKAEVGAITNTGGTIRDLAFSPNGKLLATVGDGGYETVRVWDVTTRKLVQELPGHRSSRLAVTWNPTGTLLATGASDGDVILWDTQTWTRAGTLRNSPNVYALAFSPDGKLLAVGGADTLIRLWDVSRKQPLAELSGHFEYVHGLAFNPDGSRLVSGSGDGTLRVWDTLAPAERRSLNESRRGARPIQ